jgi:hypothetical protein
MPKHLCFNCHKYLPTRQGLNTHISHRRTCRAAYQALLAKQHIHTYDPQDPDDHPWDDDPGPECKGLFEGGEELDIDSWLDQTSPNLLPISSADSLSGDMNSDPSHTTHHDPTYIVMFPTSAGEVYGQAPTRFEARWRRLHASGKNIHHPFRDNEEWQLAETLMTSGLSLQKMDKLLKLPVVRWFFVEGSRQSLICLVQSRCRTEHACPTRTSIHYFRRLMTSLHLAQRSNVTISPSKVTLRILPVA